MITLPGGKYILPVDYWEYLENGKEGGPCKSNHPVMLYQDQLIKFLNSLKPEDRISKAKELLQFNRWHYKPVENYALIENYLIDNSVNGFPSSFYFGFTTTRNGDVIEWHQSIFKSQQDFKVYLSTIEMMIKIQIDRAKNESLSKQIEKEEKHQNKKANLNLKNIFGEQTGTFRTDFKKILQERQLINTKVQIFQDVIYFMWHTKKDFPHNVSAITRLFIHEFGNDLGKDFDSLRKGLSYKNKGENTPDEPFLTPFKKYC